MVPTFWLQILIEEGLTHKRWYFSKRWVNYFRFYVTFSLGVVFTIFKIRANGNDVYFFIYRSISKFPFEIDNSHPGLKVCRLHVRLIIWNEKVSSRPKFDYFLFFAFFVKLWLRRIRITICIEMISTYCLQILREEDFANKIWYLSRRSDK